ncbi:MAG: hypothetical protein PHS46_08140, partial [Candidatus Omnitrophica bacterium]|nr:hypothetical protein [Candidatus Omnitrophota bacterium]
SYAWDPSQGSSGQFVWTQEVSGTYAYEYHGFVAYSDEVTYVANDRDSLISYEKPDEASLIILSRITTDMTQSSVSDKISGATQYFNIWGTALYEVTNEYADISGVLTLTSSGYRHNTSFDSRGRIMGYSEVIDEYVDGAVASRTESVVTLGSYDNKNRYTTMTSHSVEESITSGVVDGALSLATDITRTNMTYDSLGQLTGYTEVLATSDAADKQIHSTVVISYDLYGRLAAKTEDIHEVNVSGASVAIDHSYTVTTTIEKYNAKGQATRMTTTTLDGDLRTIEADIADRVYDTQGRLTYSSIRISEVSLKGGSVTYVRMVDPSANTIFIVKHGLSTYDWIYLDADVLPEGLTAGYYMVYKYSENAIKLIESIDANDIIKFYDIETKGVGVTWAATLECNIYTTTTNITGYNTFGQVLQMTQVTINDGLTTTTVDTADRKYDTSGRLTYSNTSIAEQDSTGTVLNHTYTTETTIANYNTLGQVLRMTTVTVDDGLTTIETDVAYRGYDTKGRLTYSSICVNEFGKEGESVARVRSISLGDNTLIIPIHGLSTYDWIYLDAAEMPEGLAAGYYMVYKYDSYKIKLIKGIDAQGIFTFYDIENFGTNVTWVKALNNTYTVTTTISSYNSLGQILRMTTTTVDDGLTTTETDTT